jgi:hypothetical protein
VENPRLAGWTFLVNEKDPQRDELTMIEEWEDWIIHNYLALRLEGQKIPQYILIIGGPEQYR